MFFKSAFAFSALFWLVAGVCFVAPLGWIAVTLISNPNALDELRLDSFRVQLLTRTIAYNASVAVVATLIAIPAAIAIGRGRGIWTKPLLLLLPISLLLPSIAFEYGWKQTLRLTGAFPSPQSGGDIARCVWTLAAWLWPIPAAMGAMALRRVDASILEQASLDGVLGRMTLRILAKPQAVACAIVFVLASQEFAVFEPSGISVVATEVRMVFETGAYSSNENPITQTFGAAGGEPMGSRGQNARAAAAIFTALPLTVLTIVIAVVVWVAARRLAVEGEMHVGPRASIVRAPAWVVAVAYLLIGITSVLPIVAMVMSLQNRVDAVRIWKTFSPQILGSLSLAMMAMCVALCLSVLQLSRKRRVVIVLASMCFLVGGQMLAIGLIRLFNHQATAIVYDTFMIAVLAYVSRFGWLALAGAATTWQRPWVSLRDMAAVDGASSGQILWRVVLPLAWPTLLAAGLLVGVLSMTEVAATVLLSPQNPQPLVPMLLGWVHLQRYDAMIEGTLLLCGVVVLAAAAIVGVAWLARRSSIALGRKS